MNIEDLTQTDIFHLEKLQPDGWPDIIPSFNHYLAQSFCLPIKVCQGKEIIGVGAGILFGKTAWLAHIIVHPEFRGRGVGLKSVIHLVDRLKKFKCASISLIATDMGYPVYKKARFTEQTDYVFFEKKTPCSLGEGSDHIFPYTRKYLKDLLLLDRAVSGEDRRTVLIEKIMTASVYEKNGTLKGCYFPDLGEGMIIADEIEAGIELMKVKYSISGKAVLPAGNTAGIQFLKENGFAETLRAKRMVWGRQFLWQPEKLYSRISGRLG